MGRWPSAHQCLDQFSQQATLSGHSTITLRVTIFFAQAGASIGSRRFNTMPSYRRLRRVLFVAIMAVSALKPSFLPKMLLHSLPRYGFCEASALPHQQAQAFRTSCRSWGGVDKPVREAMHKAQFEAGLVKKRFQQEAKAMAEAVSVRQAAKQLVIFPVVINLPSWLVSFFSS